MIKLQHFCMDFQLVILITQSAQYLLEMFNLLAEKDVKYINLEGITSPNRGQFKQSLVLIKFTII